MLQLDTVGSPYTVHPRCAAWHVTNGPLLLQNGTSHEFKKFGSLTYFDVNAIIQCVPAAAAGFLCDKAAVLGAAIQETSFVYYCG